MLPDETTRTFSFNQETGFLLNEFAEYLASHQAGNREIAESFSRILYLFVRMMHEEGMRSHQVASDARHDRTAAFNAFLARILAAPQRTSPLFYITRGLSYLNYLPEQPFERPAVEIGCESGYSSSILFRQPFEFGLDINPAYEPLIREAGMHAKYVVIPSAEDIPLADGSVATIVMNNTLYHASDRDRIFREMHRVLRPGGRVLFDDIGAALFDIENRPMVRFLQLIGGRETAQRFLQARSEVYLTGRRINPHGLLTDRQYAEYLTEFGFTDVRARQFCSPALTSFGYATHDIEFMFAIREPELTPDYAAFVAGPLAAAIVDDEVICGTNGGSYLFVTARRGP